MLSRFFLFSLIFSISFCLSAQTEAELKKVREDVEELSHKKYKGREAGTKSEEAAAEFIAKRYKELGLKPMGDKGTYFQHFDFPKSKDMHTGVESKEMLKGMNVVGMVDNGAKSYVIIGAHFDHLGMGGPGSGSLSTEVDVHNGADDNASGVAAILYISEKLMQGKAKRNNYLIVAFTGEEKGLYGSSSFLKHPPDFLNTMNYMLNFDMVGRLNPEKGIIINGVGTSPIWKAELEKADTTKMKFKTTESGVGPSDHTSFYLKDIPCLHFFTGSHEDYHKPSDDPEKINYEGIIQISEFALTLIEDLNPKLKLAFSRTKDDNNSAPRFKVTLGVVPDYLFDGKGMRIEGIRDDKPAAKAGILAGDIVVRIGEVDVVDMRTYMVGLSALEEGSKARVKVQRGSEELEFEVQF